MLKRNGIEKGDRVCIYMQMIPEILVACLACARIGAVHNVVFGGFSSESIAERINNSTSKLVMTQDNGVRGAKYDIPMFDNVFNCFDSCTSLQTILVVSRTNSEDVRIKVEKSTKCKFIKDELSAVEDICPCEEMDSEDPLFIL